MKDLMTPRQRQQALAAGAAIDRLPIVMFDNLVSAQLVGMTYQESEANGANLAKKLIASYQTYGHDAVSVIYSTKGMASLLGSQIQPAVNAPASIKQYALEDITELDQLDPSRVTFEADIYQQKVYEACQRIDEAIGSEVDSRIHISAPFTLAAGLIAPERLLRAIRKQPEAGHQLLELTTSIFERIVDKFCELDHVYFSLSDPVASGSLISPKVYQQFVQPYTQRAVARVKAHGRHASMHICGNTSKMLESMVATGIDSLSLDQVVDLKMARDLVGDQVTLIGNINPVEVFWQGTPDLMENAVAECYQQAGDNPAGFWIAPGCDIPGETPLSQLEAYMQSARHHAKLAADQYWNHDR